jgi:hypothetical protein
MSGENEARVQRRKASVQRCKKFILQLPNQGLDMGNKALTAPANAFTKDFVIQLKSLPKSRSTKLLSLMNRL